MAGGGRLLASNTSALVSFLIRYVLRPSRSVFIDEKKLSIAALLILQTMPVSAIRAGWV